MRADACEVVRLGLETVRDDDLGARDLEVEEGLDILLDGDPSRDLRVLARPHLVIIKAKPKAPKAA